MKVKGQNHVYRYLPDFLDNRQRKPEEQFYVECKAFTPREKEFFAFAIMNIQKTAKNPAEAAEKVNKRTFELVNAKISKVVNLEVEKVGKIETFSDMHKHAPAEIIGDVSEAIRVGYKLQLGDQDFVNGAEGVVEATTTIPVAGVQSLFSIVPDFLDNKILPPEEQCWLELSALSASETESLLVEQARCADSYPVDKAMEEFNSSYEKVVCKHVHSMHNLDVDGVGIITTAEQLIKDGPSEIVEQVRQLVLSVTNLTRADQKK
jgi:hypothetical protein